MKTYHFWLSGGELLAAIKAESLEEAMWLGNITWGDIRQNYVTIETTLPPG